VNVSQFTLYVQDPITHINKEIGYNLIDGAGTFYFDNV
jgi:hypothetical protein